MSYRLGVDVGGTFTDVLLINELSGEFHTAKVPSTPEAIFVAMLDNLDAKTTVAIHAVQREKTIGPGQDFTDRVWSLDTRLFRPDPLA